MYEITVIPATRDHVMALAPRLRPGDAAELEAAGIGANKALWRSYRGSVFAKTAFVNGEVAAMWGMCGCALGTTGRPWLLTAPPAERVPLSFVRIGRSEVERMLALCPRLVGVVDAAYARAIGFLAMVGFQLSAPFPYGPHEAPFREYRMHR